MSETPFTAGQGAVWVQPSGPNTKPMYLGCHEVGEVSEGQGDVTLLYCPSAARSGRNCFRHQTYASTCPESPHYQLRPGEHPAVGSEEFRRRMRAVGEWPVGLTFFS